MHRLPYVCLVCCLAVASGCVFSTEGSYDFPPDDPGAGTGDGDGGGGDWMPDPNVTCFFDESDPGTPAATIEHAFETLAGQDVVHVRLTLDPRFVDNTFGATAIGWGDDGHEFDKLVGSDKAQLQLLDADGASVFEVKLDYLSKDDLAPSGYASLGVEGKDGGVLIGEPSAVIDATTSLSRNLNERGYGGFTLDSPATDDTYRPNPAAPDWDYRVVYEVWVASSVFGDVGFGAPHIEEVHASPSKAADNTIIVEPMPCPEDWCNDPDGCYHDPTDTSDEPDACATDTDCAIDEFCSDQGTCLPGVV